MSWRRLRPRYGSRLSRENPVRVSVGSVGMSISVSPSIAQQLGWSKGVLLTFDEGEGIDAGHLLIAVHPDQAATAEGWRCQLGSKKQSQMLKLVLRSGEIDGMPKKLPIQAAEYRTNGELLIVRLPWAKGAHQSSPVPDSNVSTLAPPPKARLMAGR